MRTEILTCTEMTDFEGEAVTLRATVTGIEPARDPHAIRLFLADVTGSCCLLVEDPRLCRISMLQPWMPIESQVEVRLCDSNSVGRLLDWRPLHCDHHNAALLLPRSECPPAAHQALDQLVDMVDAIRTPCVRQAINALIYKVSPNILAAPGRHRDHHAYPGGLLAHAVEVMFRAQEECLYLFPFDNARHDLVGLVAFAHDLGKVLTNPESKANTFYAALGHQNASLALVGPALCQLTDQDPELGQLAGRMLTWLNQPPGDRSVHTCPEALAVQRAVEYSALLQSTGGIAPNWVGNPPPPIWEILGQSPRDVHCGGAA